jgi:hypothetical protein
MSIRFDLGNGLGEKGSWRESVFSRAFRLWAQLIMQCFSS